METSTVRKFFIKLKSWEYWPVWAVYFPVILYWLWCSLKARSFFYFAAANPGIKNGGMAGCSKYETLQKIDKKPETLLFQPGVSAEEILPLVFEKGIQFPFIAKPDEGERGWGVSKISGKKELEAYLSKTEVPFIIQEYIDLPVEAGVFYIRHPENPEGRITSLVIKDMLKVQGDGHSTLLELITKNDRAFLQLDTLKEGGRINLQQVPGNGQEIVLNTIGNHCLGTTFLNGNQYITTTLNESFDKIARTIEGYYYGRFDVKANSIKDLESGNVIIMELNGVNSEPAHIYQPGYSLIKGLKELLFHWKTMYKISQKNRKNGYPIPSNKKGWAETRRIVQFNKRYKHRF